MAVDFNPAYRSTWMFPRNIRKIHPWKMAQICQVLNQLSLNQNDWTQETQNEFSLLLTDGNLKSKNTIRNSKSGRANRYSSQLESLGLIYRSEKNIYLTLAGESLVDFEEPLKVIQTQLLNHQYPSSYSLNKNVKINPEIKIKPFVFALKFLNDSEIQYLKEYELVFLLIYGHNSACYEFIKEKILSFRKQNGNKGAIINFIDKPSQDLYTPRSKNKSQINKMLKEAFEVANTMKNYLVSSCLAYEDKSDKKISISNEFDDIINIAINASEYFIPVNDRSNEYFLRSYGAWKKLYQLKVERKKLSTAKQ